MPLNTVMPIDLRALAPAPLAITSGTTPRMKANDVMRIGRKRACAASTAASRMGLPSMRRTLAGDLDDQDGVLGRQRDQQDSADLRVEIVVDAQNASSTSTGPTSASGTERMIDERRVPALVLPGEHQIDQQQRHRETKYIWLPTTFS